MKVLVAQSCLTLCDPMDCTPPGFSVHGILQARILEWVAISFSRGPSNPGNKPGCLALQADSLLSATREALYLWNINIIFKTKGKKVLVAQSYLTLQSYGLNPPGSSVHGILQSGILEWVAISFSRGSSWAKDQTWVSCIENRLLTSEPPRKHKHNFLNKVIIIQVFFHMAFMKFTTFWGIPCGSDSKESAFNVGDLFFIPGSRRSHGEGTGYPLWYPREFHG